MIFILFASRLQVLGWKNHGRSSSQGPHSHILMTGGPSDFWGSEILAQSDFLGSMKYAGILLGRKKSRWISLGCGKRAKGFFWVC